MTTDRPRNSIEFRLWGRYALFTDPLTKLGGEKLSYQVPTYEALKGVAKSIYWKPTLVWIIDEVRVMKRIRTQTKGMKPLEFGGGNTLAIYTFLSGVEYQVRAHFEWNMHRPELAHDRIDGKHYEMARRSLERGGRQDIFLGTRDCQGYVEPCQFGAGTGDLDQDGSLALGFMFHGFDYPDEAGTEALHARFWRPTIVDGRIGFPHPEQCTDRRFVRKMATKRFSADHDVLGVDAELSRAGGLS